jgi:predicted peroxiredoxin
MFPFLTINQLKEEAAKTSKKLVEVFYAGMGVMMVRKGAFEKVTYPWFEPVMHEIEMSRDFSSEDVSLCWKWHEKGVRIFVDPEIVVGHEKSIVIR